MDRFHFYFDIKKMKVKKESSISLAGSEQNYYPAQLFQAVVSIIFITLSLSSYYSIYASLAQINYVRISNVKQLTGSTNI